MIKHLIDAILQKKFDDDLTCIMKSRNMKKKIKFKIVKVMMEYTSKTRSSHLLLSTPITDKFRRTQLDNSYHLSTYHNNKSRQ
jgi:hypothetical protein